MRNGSKEISVLRVVNMENDLNNLERKKKKQKTFEEWENSHNFKTVDPKEVKRAIAQEYDCREGS